MHALLPVPDRQILRGSLRRMTAPEPVAGPMRQTQVSSLDDPLRLSALCTDTNGDQWHNGEYMQLYVDQDGGVPSPRRERMYLAEKGIEIPLVRMELHKENRTREFRQKNPIGTLPVLELDDGRCLSESMAICRYIEELNPDPPLFGSEPFERAVIEMWSRRVEHYLYLPIDYLPMLTRGAPQEAAEEFESWATQFSDLLDKTLGNQDFLCGESISIADVFAFGALDYGDWFRNKALTRLHKLDAWFRKIKERPSATA